MRTREQVAERLDAAGVRFTRARRQVVAALEVSPGPLSAADLHEGLRTEVPVSSLYRTLAVLTDTGVLTSHHGTDGVARFELAEWLAGHHHHVVCSVCGSVSDVDLPVEHEERLDEISHRIAELAEFSFVSHSLDLVGTCRSCAP